MNDADFRRRLEMDAAGVASDDLSRMFDGISAKRVPSVRTHMAFAALDAYLMMAADIYGRKGTIFGLARQPSCLTISRHSQIVTCTHYLNEAAIGFRYQGDNLDPSMKAIVDEGPLAVAEVWAPRGDGFLFGADRGEIQDHVDKIVKFLK